MRDHLSVAVGGLFALSIAVLAQTPASPQPPAPRPAAASAGATLYEASCATCHSGPTDPRIPAVAVLRQRAPDAILEALTIGVMRQQGEALSDAERRAVAEYLSGRSIGAASGSTASALPAGRGTAAATAPSAATAMAGRCAVTPPFEPSEGAQWNGWGVDIANTRFQPAAQAGLTAEQASKLVLKWAFGFPNATGARAQPTIVGGRVFVGSQSGDVYALDAKTGCIIWTFRAASGVRTAIVLGPRLRGTGTAAYFGDGRAVTYALDAGTGALLWSTPRLDMHPSAHITGTPTLYQERLYVPIASGEEGQGGNATYECCTFRGSLVALSAATGAVVWKTYTIPNESKPIGRNNSGTVRWGPSGAGVWSSPTVDVKRRVVYAATGNMYTDPQQTTSDAILAFDMESGKVVWAAQATTSDVFLVGCNGNPPTGANCPKDAAGPDFDFGNAPILAKLPNGRDAIVIGQKSGVGWAFDPDKQGAVIWQYKAGRGSALGGMEWGSAVDSERAYFAVADGGNMQTAGLHAVRLETGERAWYAAPSTPKCGNGRGCTAALSAAITVIPGVVFAGSNDGAVRAHSTKDGAVIWEFDTNREFETVNGVKASGASINQAGPTVAGGMVYVSSGYGSLGGRPGNVLLAFGVQ
jgi:polyvinyl alcohol dehydrogenase (cytochrome)